MQPKSQGPNAGPRYVQNQEMYKTIQDPNPLTIQHLQGRLEISAEHAIVDGKYKSKIGFFNRHKQKNNTSFGNYTVITSKRVAQQLNTDLFSAKKKAKYHRGLGELLQPATMLLQPPAIANLAQQDARKNAERKGSQLLADEESSHSFESQNAQ